MPLVEGATPRRKSKSRKEEGDPLGSTPEWTVIGPRIHRFRPPDSSVIGPRIPPEQSPTKCVDARTVCPVLGSVTVSTLYVISLMAMSKSYRASFARPPALSNVPIES